MRDESRASAMLLLQQWAKTWKLPKLLDIGGLSGAPLPAADLGAAPSHGGAENLTGSEKALTCCMDGSARNLTREGSPRAKN